MKKLEISDFVLSSSIAIPSGLFDFLEEIAHTDFKKVEIRVESDHWDYDDPESTDRIRFLCRKNAIKVISLHAPMYALICCPDEYERIKALREVEKAVVIAHRLSARYVVFHADTQNDYQIGEKEWALQKSLEELSDFSFRWNVELLMENLMKPRLATDPQDIAKYLKPFDNMGACLDLGHLRISGNKLDSLPNNFLSRVRSVHLNDNDGLRDRHFLPGMGDAPGHSKGEIEDFFKSGFECVIEASKSVKKDLNLGELLLFAEERMRDLIA
ncbi:sugar phosphate isomerase/epimerase [candidate division WOR-3 bacterium]|nr:sugar phosphate isomerase/epimerase [candidate division WOR-3 bacterium]